MGVVSVQTATPAAAAAGFSFSFDTGNVAMAAIATATTITAVIGTNGTMRAKHVNTRLRFSEHWNERKHRDSDRDGIPDNRDNHPKRSPP